MTSKITISNRSAAVTQIDIEGVIGVPDTFQENGGDKISTYEKFKAKVDKIRSISSAKVVVNIRSIGGNVNDALLIHDALVALDTEVTTRCYGYVASAATIIAQGASKGRRQMSSNSLYLIHRAISAVEGNSENLEQTVELLNKTDERIASIYAARSGKPVEFFIELMGQNSGNGRWLSAEEAVDAELVDSVIGAEKISNIFDREVRQLNLPPLPENVTQPAKALNIKEIWSLLLEHLGISDSNFGSDSSTELVFEMQEDKLQDNHISTSEIVNDSRVDENLNPATPQNQAEAQDVANRLAELEVQTKRMKAAPTTLLPIEDPSPNDIKLSPNAISYSDDARNFKQ